MTNLQNRLWIEAYQSAIEPTAEQFAKGLNASIKFSWKGTVAFNFPTKQSSILFCDWLESKGYYYEWKENRYNWTYEVIYQAPKVS